MAHEDGIQNPDQERRLSPEEIADLRKTVEASMGFFRSLALGKRGASEAEFNAYEGLLRTGLDTLCAGAQAGHPVAISELKRLAGNVVMLVGQLGGSSPN